MTSSELLDLAHARNETFSSLLRRVAYERLLHRLERSNHSADLIVRGAFLFCALLEKPHRETARLDLACLTELEPTRIEQVMTAIASVPGEDGWRFQLGRVHVERAPHPRAFFVRVRLDASLEAVRLPIDLVIDHVPKIVPPSREFTFRPILPGPAIRVLAYPAEKLVAEKLHAITTAGLGSQRMKHIYDAYELVSQLAFDAEPVMRSISSTFGQNDTRLMWEEDTYPLVYDSVFLTTRVNQRQWNAFLSRIEAPKPHLSLQSALSRIESFFMPTIHPIIVDQPFKKYWPPGGPWK
jgi:hypothetical protein